MTIEEFSHLTKHLTGGQRAAIINKIELSGLDFTSENVVNEIRNFAL